MYTHNIEIWKTDASLCLLITLTVTLNGKKCVRNKFSNIRTRCNFRNRVFWKKATCSLTLLNTNSRCRVSWSRCTQLISLTKFSLYSIVFYRRLHQLTLILKPMYVYYSLYAVFFLSNRSTEQYFQALWVMSPIQKHCSLYVIEIK